MFNSLFNVFTNAISKIIIKKNSKKIRLRSIKELEIRKKEFLKICDILDNLKIRYFLQTGILLGAIRHKNFIPWDWDVELSVFTDETLDKIDLLINKIELSGFIIEKYSRDYASFKIDFVGSLDKETTLYTIQGWCHNIKKKTFWRKNLNVPDHFFLRMRYVKLFNRNHLAPYFVENYLEYQYGDWKKPIRSNNPYVYLSKQYRGISLLKGLYRKFLKDFQSLKIRLKNIYK